jgi:alkyldihydroxyacetonephosphate synthase
MPDRVVWPEDEHDVVAVLRAAQASGVPVVVVGAGSGVCGGARAEPGGWTLDVKRLDRIGRVDPETWIVEVEAGVNGQHLEDELARQGFTCGHSPSSIGCSTVGGWAAARGAGQLSNRYGVFEDLVVGLDAVAPGVGAFTVGLAGSRAFPRRPEAELDLILGSEGTLAVVTRLRLRVRPLPEQRWLRGYRFDDVPAALDAMRTLMQGELWPAALRLYDPVDTWIGGRTKPRLGTRRPPSWWRRWLDEVDRLPAVHRRTLALPLSLPSVLQGLADRLASGCLLVVGWEGSAPVVEAASSAGHTLLVQRGTDLGAEPGERWWASRHAVSYKLMPVFERGGFADTMEIAGRWSRLPAIYQAVRAAVRPHALVMAHMSHSYPEGGCIYFSFAGRGDAATYEAVWRVAQEAVLREGGTISHHHGVGTLKARWASAEAGAAVQGWRSLRETLDPTGLLGRGRLFREDVVSAGVPAAFAEKPPIGDGLTRVPLGEASRVPGRLWPWETLPHPARHARSPWQTGAVEVHGALDGAACALGRGPRSAAGPDLRGHLLAQGAGVEVAVAVATPGLRWTGRAVVPHPWAAARALLRADLRPGLLGVVDGALHVGFRGPAAAAFGALASKIVPLVPCESVEIPLASGALVPCADDDPRAVAATSEHVLRREDP